MAGQLSRLESWQRYYAKNKERIALTTSLKHYKKMVKIKEKALKEFDKRKAHEAKKKN